MCISGIPSELITNDNFAELVEQIAKTLGAKCDNSHFVAYAVASKKFVIVRFHNAMHKRSLLGKIRVKKSLMVEEVFKSIKSNSQIYLNDHLSPYFNKLYLMARNAKREGKLASASSYGGKIRARKYSDDAPIIITSESQLQEIIDDDDGDSIQSQQHTDDNMETSNSTSNQSRTSTPAARIRPRKLSSNRTKSSGTPNSASSSTKPLKRKGKTDDTRLRASKKTHDHTETTNDRSDVIEI